MYYRIHNEPGDNAACGDVIPYYENGTYYLFHLVDFRDREKYGEGFPWHLVTTTDLIHYVDRGEVLAAGGPDEQDLGVFTGSVYKSDDLYYIFYTGCNWHYIPKNIPQQVILRATSRDLLHWEKDRNFKFSAPAGYEMHDFRDPFVWYDANKNLHKMIIAGVRATDAPKETRGVTLLYTTRDLDNWDFAGEFYAPDAYITHECPDYFRMGDKYYLIFSEFNGRFATVWRMADGEDAPFVTPKIDTFDSRALYAAKSVYDGKRRLLFGWNATRTGDSDKSWWEWGGHIIPHEIYPGDDGELLVRCPEEILGYFDKPISLSPAKTFGTVEKNRNAVTVGTPSGRGTALYEKLPDLCRVDVDFTAGSECGIFGLLLRASSDTTEGYKIVFEPKYNRLAFDRSPRFTDFLSFYADHERYCPIVPGEKNHLTAIVDGSVLEVYVNEKIAMSARLYDLKGPFFGVFAEGNDVTFENLAVKVPGKK